MKVKKLEKSDIQDSHERLVAVYAVHKRIEYVGAFCGLLGYTSPSYEICLFRLFRINLPGMAGDRYWVYRFLVVL